MDGLARFPARYFDGRTAAPRDVEIVFGDSTLAIRRPGGLTLAHWPAADIVLAEKPRPGESVRLGLQDTTARLVVEDHAVLSEVKKIAPHAGRRGRFKRKLLVRTGAWAALAAGATAVVFLVLIPLLAEQFARQVPHAVKRDLGEAALEQVSALLSHLPSEKEPVRFCTGRAGLDALERLTGRLMAGLDGTDPVRPVVISARMVNGFALPGGIVVLTDGLLQAAESPGEVAGVLAHELGHVVYDHPTRSLFRATAVSLLAGIILGDILAGGVSTGAAEHMLNRAYSLEQEREADRFAIDRLNAAGISGTGFARLFERLLAEDDEIRESPVLQLLSSHPLTRERLDLARSRATSAGRALSPGEWKHLQQVCRVRVDYPAE